MNAKSAAVQQRPPIATVNPATGELVQEFTPMSCPVSTPSVNTSKPQPVLQWVSNTLSPRRR
jgi:hypothetical protein